MLGLRNDLFKSRNIPAVPTIRARMRSGIIILTSTWANFLKTFIEEE
jgi:hypothetical protein